MLIMAVGILQINSAVIFRHHAADMPMMRSGACSRFGMVAARYELDTPFLGLFALEATIAWIVATVFRSASTRTTIAAKYAVVACDTAPRSNRRSTSGMWRSICAIHNGDRITLRSSELRACAISFSGRLSQSQRVFR